MVAGSHLFFGLPPTGWVSLSDGYTAEYYVRGQGDPLVLVPGLAGGTGLLRPLIDALCVDRQVITFELRGEKSCILDRSFELDRLSRDLRELMDTLGIEKPELMGVSFGGAVAFDFATRWPRRIESLVVQGASPAHQNRVFDGLAKKVLDRVMLSDKSPFLDQFFRMLTAQRTFERYGLDFITEQCWSTDQAVMAHRFSLIESYDITDRMDRLEMPVLALAAELDLLVPPSEHHSWINSVPTAELRSIAGAGHFAFVTHADQMAMELRAFRRASVAVH